MNSFKMGFFYLGGQMNLDGREVMHLVLSQLKIYMRRLKEEKELGSQGVAEESLDMELSTKTKTFHLVDGGE
jgi:hypothetical protein